MFEHLDDPNPPSPEPGSCARVMGQARHRRQLRHRRVAASATGAVAVGVLAVAGFFFTEGRRLDQVAHVDLATQSSNVTGVQTILVVGTDRGMHPPAETAGADSLAVVRVDAGAHTASVLSIPRDLAVPNTVSGADERVSAIFRSGGPGVLVASLHAALDIDITHYIQVDPGGFEKLIDSMGGVKLRASVAMRDTRSGLQLKGGACTRLDGTKALALARSRHAEVDPGGGWLPLNPAETDMERMARDGILGQAILTAIQAVDLTDPIAIDHLVDTFVAHVTVDAGLHQHDLIDLVRTVRTVPAANVELVWLPVDPSQRDGRAVFTLGADWQAIVSGFLAGDPLMSTAPPPGIQGAPTLPTPRQILEPC